MTGAAPYPETAQVADGLIVNQLKMVHTEVKDGFGRQERYNDKMEARFETMVTKAEFRAEIGRVNAEHNHLKDTVSSTMNAYGEEMRAGFASIHDEGKDRVAKSRWFTGIIITAASAVSGFVFNLLSGLPK